MRKAIIPIILLAAAGFAAYHFWIKKADAPEGPKPKPLAIAENTNSFNQSFAKLLTAYYDVRDALVASDAAKATATARNLLVAADSLKLDEIKGDSTGAIKATAKSYTETIDGSAKGMAGE